MFEIVSIRYKKLSILGGCKQIKGIDIVFLRIKIEGKESWKRGLGIKNGCKR